MGGREGSREGQRVFRHGRLLTWLGPYLTEYFWRQWLCPAPQSRGPGVLGDPAPGGVRLLLTGFLPEGGARRGRGPLPHQAPIPLAFARAVVCKRRGVRALARPFLSAHVRGIEHVRIVVHPPSLFPELPPQLQLCPLNSSSLSPRPPPTYFLSVSLWVPL